MATTLPVRVDFRLPDGWTGAPPDEVDAPGAAFVALHPGSVEDGFTANITVAGDVRAPNMNLDVVADESLARLAATVGSVRLRERASAGSPRAPAMTQVLDLAMSVAGRELRLEQHQAYVTVRDADEPARHAVIEFALTCTPDQFGRVRDDFHQFVTSMRAA